MTGDGNVIVKILRLNMPKYEVRVMKRIMQPVGGEGFCQRIHVEIDNEGAAEYLKCTNEDLPDQALYIEPGQWPTLRELIDEMIKDCRRHP